MQLPAKPEVTELMHRLDRLPEPSRFDASMRTTRSDVGRCGFPLAAPAVRAMDIGHRVLVVPTAQLDDRRLPTFYGIALDENVRGIFDLTVPDAGHRRTREVRGLHDGETNLDFPKAGGGVYVRLRALPGDGLPKAGPQERSTRQLHLSYCSASGYNELDIAFVPVPKRRAELQSAEDLLHLGRQIRACQAVHPQARVMLLAGEDRARPVLLAASLALQELHARGELSSDDWIDKVAAQVASARAQLDGPLDLHPAHFHLITRVKEKLLAGEMRGGLTGG